MQERSSALAFLYQLGKKVHIVTAKYKMSRD